MKVRFLVRAGGLILMVLACFYVAAQLMAYPDVMGRLWSVKAGAFLCVCLVCSLAADSFLALNWIALVRDKTSGVARGKLYVIYVYTQFAKYVPGNVLHFAGRYMLGLKAGLTHKALSAGLFLEPLGLVFMGGVLATPMILARGYMIAQGIGIGSLWLVPVAGLTFLAAAALVLARWGKARIWLAEIWGTVADRVSGRLMAIFLRYGLYFLCQTLVVVLALVFSGYVVSWSNAPMVVSAVCLSWLAGYVVPGAPGGMGVREFVLIQSLPWIPEQILLQTVILWRLSSLLSDLIYFGLGTMTIGGRGGKTVSS